MALACADNDLVVLEVAVERKFHLGELPFFKNYDIFKKEVRVQRIAGHTLKRKHGVIYTNEPRVLEELAHSLGGQGIPDIIRFSHPVTLREELPDGQPHSTYYAVTEVRLPEPFFLRIPRRIFCSVEPADYNGYAATSLHLEESYKEETKGLAERLKTEAPLHVVLGERPSEPLLRFRRLVSLDYDVDALRWTREKLLWVIAQYKLSTPETS
ncbi:hypothetical protein D6789_03190 [Candidatus Woesearchaeota archaeon]|nr:MAG: hypothetical protein D6789_03190 [Candidatus Woesearchaeota archaeon]